MEIISVGHNNLIPTNEIQMILQINSSPSKELISKAGKSGHLVDTADRKKRKAIVLSGDGYIILSSLTPKTISDRYREQGGRKLEPILAIGKNNFIPSNKILMFLQVDSRPVKKLVEAAREADKLIDATGGKGTSTVILMSNGFLALSSVASGTLARNYKKIGEGEFKNIISIGHENYIPVNKISMFANVDSRPIKELLERAKSLSMFVNATRGKGRRAVILTTEGHVVLSAIASNSLAKRYSESDSDEREEE